MTKRRKMDAVDPMAVVTRFIDAANHHDVDALRACVHREFESVQPIHPGRNFRGPGQLISNWKAIFEAEPGFRLSVRRASVTDNTVWVEVHGAGASAEAAGIFIVGIEDGRIRWIRVYSDLVEPVPEPPEPEPEPQPPTAEDDAATAAAEADGEGAEGAYEPRMHLVGDADAGTRAVSEPEADAGSGAGEDAAAIDEPPGVPRALTLVHPRTEADHGEGVATADDPGAPEPMSVVVQADDDASDQATSIWAERPDEILAVPASPEAPSPEATGPEATGPEATGPHDASDVTVMTDVAGDMTETTVVTITTDAPDTTDAAEAADTTDAPDTTEATDAPGLPGGAVADDAPGTLEPESTVEPVPPTVPAPGTDRGERHSWRRWRRGDH